MKGIAIGLGEGPTSGLERAATRTRGGKPWDAPEIFGSVSCGNKERQIFSLCQSVWPLSSDNRSVRDCMFVSTFLAGIGEHLFLNTFLKRLRTTISRIPNGPLKSTQ
jgi:hypothetical protein